MSWWAGLALIVTEANQDRPDRSWIGSVRKPSSTIPAKSGPRAFATLDAYLAHLRAYAAPIDRAWYREVRPDVFKLETTLRDGRGPQYFTREELERRFGFR